jgi:glycerophosphoryl diester phosphodiesterase
MAYGSEPAPMALAHRGGAALATENTLAAFGLASALGLRYLETDVRLTSDGQLVCFHDATLDRVTDGRGEVRHHDLARVRRKDVRERVCLAGAWDGALATVRREVPGVRTALGWRSLSALVSSSRTGARPSPRLATGEFAHVPLRLGRVPVFVERLVEGALRIGVRVVVWTVDDVCDMHRVLDAGVDGVITDRPDLLREVLIARGQWLPAGDEVPVRTPAAAP